MAEGRGRAEPDHETDDSLVRVVAEAVPAGHKDHGRGVRGCKHQGLGSRVRGLGPHSSGWWLRPLRQGTKIMAVGATRPMKAESW